MKLSVRKVDGSCPHELTIDPDSTIFDLKVRLGSLHGCDPTRIRLVIGRVVPKDDSASLSLFDLTDGGVIRFHICAIPGGAPPAPPPSQKFSPVESPDVKSIDDPSLPSHAREIRCVRKDQLDALVGCGFPVRKARNALILGEHFLVSAEGILTAGIFDAERANVVCEGFHLAAPSEFRAEFKRLENLAAPFTAHSRLLVPRRERCFTLLKEQSSFAGAGDGRLRWKAVQRLLRGIGDLTPEQHELKLAIRAVIPPAMHPEFEDFVVQWRQALVAPPEKFVNPFAYLWYHRNRFAVGVLDSYLLRSQCMASLDEAMATALNLAYHPISV
jgi:hypothetical protein